MHPQRWSCASIYSSGRVGVGDGNDHQQGTPPSRAHSKLHEWVDAQAAASAGIEVLKRFSGGGTVVVDDATLFATLVMGREAVPHVEPFPRPIMAWTEGLYTHVFKHSNPHHGAFALRDNGTSDVVYQRSLLRSSSPTNIIQITYSVRTSLGATHRPSRGGDGCTTPPSCGTTNPSVWPCSSHRPAALSTAR